MPLEVRAWEAEEELDNAPGNDQDTGVPWNDGLGAKFKVKISRIRVAGLLHGTQAAAP